MFVVVSYDIEDDRRRKKVADILMNYGKRVQKSVFECVVNEVQFIAMQQKLKKLIDREATDSIRYYVLCSSCLKQVVIENGVPLYEVPNVVIV